MKKTQAALIATTFLMLVFSDPSVAQDQSHDEEFLGLLDYFRAGEPAPTIRFLNGDQQSVSLQDYEGTALVVNFWATWCAPCIAEMPALDRLNQAINDQGGMVIAINTDFDPEAATAWLRENEITSLEAFFDETGNAFFDAGGGGLPYTLVINADGFVAAEVFGDAPWDTAAAQAFVTELAVMPTRQSHLTSY